MTGLSLKLRYMVIDPCDRGPLHLPMPDGWLDLQDGRLAGTVCDWLARLAWDGWRIDAGDGSAVLDGASARDVFDLDPQPVWRDTAGCRSAWLSVGFADLDMHRPDDGVEAVVDEAYVRVWKAVDLLSLVHGAGVDGRIDRDRTPHDIAIRLPEVGRSLSRLQEALGSFPGYRLILFGDPGFAVDDAWFAVMLDGCDRISEHVQRLRASD